MSNPYRGSRVELMEVIAMARAGRIHAETTGFLLTEAVEVYARLKAGQITGRAVQIRTSSRQRACVASLSLGWFS